MAVHAYRFINSRTRWLLFALLLAVGTYLLAVTPVQTYLQQRHEMHQTEQRYHVLQSANAQLNQRVAQLQSDAEIQRLASERYELVPQGKQAYAVMPPVSAAVTSPPVKRHHEGLWSRAWDIVTFWN